MDQTPQRALRSSHKGRVPPASHPTSEFDALLCVNAGMEWVLDLAHFSNQVGDVNHLFQGIVDITARKDQVQVRLSLSDVGDLIQHGIDIEKAVAQHIEEL